MGRKRGRGEGKGCEERGGEGTARREGRLRAMIKAGRSGDGDGAEGVSGRGGEKAGGDRGGRAELCRAQASQTEPSPAQPSRASESSTMLPCPMRR